MRICEDGNLKKFKCYTQKSQTFRDCSAAQNGKKWGILRVRNKQPKCQDLDPIIGMHYIKKIII